MGTAITEMLQHHVDLGTIPGGIVASGRAGEMSIECVGAMSVNGAPLQPDAIVRIQSMTKSITTVATLLAVQGGEVSLDDPVAQWLPELADPVVLRTPEAPLEDVVPAHRSITIRDLLTNGSGYGMQMQQTPLAAAMSELDVEAGAEPIRLAADEWLRRLSTLPLAHQPGHSFRYHHSFGILGVLLQRQAGVPLDKHLRSRIFDPLGMPDTALTVPQAKAHRLPAAYRVEDGVLHETEPAAGGFYVEPAPFDTAHGELVSTAADFFTFMQMLASRGRHQNTTFLDPALAAEMTQEQVPDEAKTPDSFLPGFWEDMGWGYGVGVTTAGEHAGRYGWSGGQGTDFFIEPDGHAALLLTQVELGDSMWPLLGDFQRVVGESFSSSAEPQ